MRLIDADALMKEFAEFVAPSNNSDFADVPTWNDAVSLLGSAPTIEPEQKKGKWLMKWNSFFRRELPACSECGSGAAFKTKFCPCCGAEMGNAYKGVSI